MFRGCTICFAFLITVTMDTIGYADVINGVGLTFTGTEGFATSSVSVAQFTDPGASGLQATINWGDGTAPTVGTIAPAPAGGFVVSASHTYIDEGVYTPVVNVSDAAGNQQTILSAGTISDAALAGSGSPIFGTEGSIVSNAIVANFIDANPFATSHDFSATINWGDGSLSQGIIALVNNDQFAVIGSHVYAEAGQYAPSVNVLDAGGSQVALTSSAAIADAALSATASNIFGVEGQALSGTVATFTDANPDALASDFTATIDWGDQQSSPGTISFSNGSFVVTGSHTYADEGGYRTSVTVTDRGGATAAASDQAIVADAPLNGAFVPAFFTQYIAGSVALATFSDGNPSASLSDFNAAINWGDGTPTGAGSIISLGNSSYEVLGQHAYAYLGSYSPTLVITDEGGSTTQLVGNATVITPEPGCLAIAGAGLTMLLLRSMRGIRRR